MEIGRKQTRSRERSEGEEKRWGREAMGKRRVELEEPGENRKYSNGGGFKRYLAMPSLCIIYCLFRRMVFLRIISEHTTGTKPKNTQTGWSGERPRPKPHPKPLLCPPATLCLVNLFTNVDAGHVAKWLQILYQFNSPKQSL